jgi:anti-sigma factor RsiW
MDARLTDDRTQHASTELLSSYLDRQVGPDEATYVDRHLLACGRCADELAGLDTVRSMLRALPEVTPPRSFVLAEPAKVLRFPRLVVWSRAAAAVAAVFFVMFLSIDLLGFAANSAMRTQPSSPYAGVLRAAQPQPAGTVVAYPSKPDAAPPRPDSTMAGAAADPNVGSLTATVNQPVRERATASGVTPLRTAWMVTGVIAALLVVTAVVLSRAPGRRGFR